MNITFNLINQLSWWISEASNSTADVFKNIYFKYHRPSFLSLSPRHVKVLNLSESFKSYKSLETSELSRLSVDDIATFLEFVDFKDIKNLIRVSKIFYYCVGMNLKKVEFAAKIINQNPFQIHISMIGVLLSQFKPACIPLKSLNMRDPTIYQQLEYQIGKNEIQFIQKFTQLEELILPGFTSFSDDDLKSLVENCPNLKLLYLNGCYNKLSPKSLQYIARLKNLRHLDLSFARVDDLSLTAIVHQFPKLETLFLEHCYQLTSQGLNSITSLTNLRHLNLKHVSIDDSIRHVLSACSKLEILKLQNKSVLVSTGLAPLSSLTHLRELFLSNAQIEDRLLKRIFLHNPQLEVLELDYCITLSHKVFSSIAALKKLHKLSLKSTFIQNHASNSIAMGCKELKYLCLKSCLNISFRDFDQKFEKLRYLNIESTPIKNPSFQNLAQKCPQLMILNLSGCQHLTNVSISAFNQLAKLKAINVKGTQYSFDELCKMAEQLHDLEHLVHTKQESHFYNYVLGAPKKVVNRNGKVVGCENSFDFDHYYTNLLT